MQGSHLLSRWDSVCGAIQSVGSESDGSWRSARFLTQTTHQYSASEKVHCAYAIICSRPKASKPAHRLCRSATHKPTAQTRLHPPRIRPRATYRSAGHNSQKKAQHNTGHIGRSEALSGAQVPCMTSPCHTVRTTSPPPSLSLPHLPVPHAIEVST